MTDTTGTPVTYTAMLGHVGSDSFTYHANDGTVDGSVATVSITVVANTAPTADTQSWSVAQDTALGVILTGNDSDHLPDASLSFTVASSPSHGTLSGAAPFLTYLPTTGYAGTDSVTFTVNDGALTSATATVAIAVTVGGGPSVPVGSTTSGGGCGLGGSAAAVLLGIFGLFSCSSRLIRRRAD
ncbi:MAG: Ig-like domain-containing protein [Planctomycetes bacterium]|nr:Ig-like domain-containing protein [Planctomycetota bacterium]